MKHFLPALFILLVPFTSSAQKVSKIVNNAYKELSLRTSLTSFFDYDAGIMLGVNYRWAKHFSASLEPTFIFYNGFKTDGDVTIYPTGIKIRSDIRYNFGKKRVRSLEGFLAPEFHYKYTSTKKEDLFGINCLNGQCAYFQQGIYKELKNEVGVLFKMGIIAPLTFISKDDRLFLEIHGGVGAKQLKFKETDLPTGGSFVNLPNRSLLGFGTTTDRTTYSRPMLPVGLKLIFVL